MSAATTTAAYIQVNYEQEKEKIKEFLSGSDILKDIGTRVQIDLEKVEQFDLENDTELAKHIMENTFRYVSLFEDAIQESLPETQPDDLCNPLDLVIFQRKQRDAMREENDTSQFPRMLVRRLYNIFLKISSTVNFNPGELMNPLSIRQIRGRSVGHLVKVRGMVTRMGNVKPLATVIGYSCDKCGHESFQEVTSSVWTPLSACPSEDCKKNQSKGVLTMQSRASKFIRFQEVKLQEIADQVPMGHIPRSMTVHLCEDLTRTLNPGDSVILSGIFMPVPFSGFKALRAGLMTDTYLQVHHVEKLKKSYNQLVMTPEIQIQIEALSSDREIYSKLSRSIAPEIFGHDDVKKALLLLLVGGSTKETADGMKIRGDLNICLMGDPGVAKSQLLKYISKIAPRGVYTTGRGSSGVGLTAAVTRDPITDEMILEGGALVLADNGIACIDEFDKMDDSDRTAIHEVMEQQTISISKAGITTTLNARTCILAAANPQYGRYNVKAKPTDNINLPAALLSRFDLLFLLLDKPNMDDDLRLAQHVAYVHMHLEHPHNANEPDPIDLNLFRHYIAMAKSFDPVVSASVADYMVNCYVHLRNSNEEIGEFQYTCARTLLSIIRMASALARLRFAQQVEVGDVDEALRLMEASKSSLLNKDSSKSKDPMSMIFDLIRDMSIIGATGRLRKEILIADIRERVISKGLSDAELKRCIESYSDDDVWMVVANGSKLRWIGVEDDSDTDV